MAAVCLSLAAHVALLAIHDLGARPWAALAAFAAAFAALPLASRGRWRPTPGAILLVATLLRLLLVPLPPTLSDDVLRYLWDGKVVAAGENPYALAPEDPRLAPLRDESWRRLPHREVQTVYPPLAMAAFSISAAAPAPLLTWKALLVAADLATCALLLSLARRRRLPPGRTIWYAWSPLVTVEVAGMGHVDALGVTAVVGVLWLLVAGRSAAAATRAGVAAGGAAAAAVLVKLVPVLALPMWARQARRPALLLGVAGLVVAAGLAPVAAGVGGVPPGWVRYGVSWEFDGPLYEPLWRSFAAIDLDLAVKAGLDGLKRWTGEHDFWNRFYPFVYPQLLAKGVLAAALAAAVAASLAWRRPLAGTGALFGAVLLTSATVYPWYLLWVLPAAALRPHPAWRSLSLTLPWSYLVQHAGLPLFPWLWAAVWGPFFVLLFAGSGWSRD